MALSKIDTAAIAADAVTADIIAAGAVSADTLPAGTVVQTVHTSSVDKTFSTTSTSTVAATVLNTSITPTSSSSKVLVTMSLTVGKRGWNVGNVVFAIQRDSTKIWGDYNSKIHYGADDGNSNYDGMDTYVIQYLDSPATTSQVTYRPMFATTNASYAVRLNRAHQVDTQYGTCHITLQEIAQ